MAHLQIPVWGLIFPVLMCVRYRLPHLDVYIFAAYSSRVWVGVPGGLFGTNGLYRVLAASVPEEDNNCPLPSGRKPRFLPIKELCNQ
jgi:hypothetical protein